jgi:hypothetical protein
VVFWKSLSKLSCICLSLEKLVNRKHFLVKEKFGLVSRKVFLFYVKRKTLFKSCGILEMLCYLVIISNLVLKLLIAIFFFWIFFILIYPIEFNLIWFLYQLWSLFLWLLFAFLLSFFLIKIFYLSDLVLILLIVIYFIWNNLWYCNYFFISSSFYFFIC